MSDVVAKPIDDKQRDRLVRRFGAGALHWLDGLPSLVSELAEKWGCTVEGMGPHGQTSVVFHCRRDDGGAAVQQALGGRQAQARGTTGDDGNGVLDLH